MKLSRYNFLPLATVKRYEKLAKARGVSDVARSPRGFLTAYKRAGGKPANLSAEWLRKRDAFISRHMAQGKNENLGGGRDPSRRHLALIMWAYSPMGKRLKAPRVYGYTPAKYSRAGSYVDGLRVGDDVPNMDSIDATVEGDFDILPGVREFPLADMEAKTVRDLFYAKDDIDRVYALAEEIGRRKFIKPLIIAIDADGPYIVEGAHRFGALLVLGKKHLPAVIVDEEVE